MLVYPPRPLEPFEVEWELQPLVLVLVLLGLRWFKKYMSIPSASCDVQMGAIALSAASVSRQLRPAMLPLSSIRKTVSNSRKKAYGESSPATGFVVAGEGARSAAGAAEYGGGGAPTLLLTFDDDDDDGGGGLRVGIVVVAVNGLVLGCKGDGAGGGGSRDDFGIVDFCAGLDDVADDAFDRFVPNLRRMSMVESRARDVVVVVVPEIVAAVEDVVEWKEAGETMTGSSISQ